MTEQGTIGALRQAYLARLLHPRDVAADAVRRAGEADGTVWIHRPDEAAVLLHVDRLDAIDIDTAPLWGVPFAIKDNVDLAGAPTTAGCPNYACVPQRSATDVERLLAAGAVPIGEMLVTKSQTAHAGHALATAAP